MKGAWKAQQYWPEFSFVFITSHRRSKGLLLLLLLCFIYCEFTMRKSLFWGWCGGGARRTVCGFMSKDTASHLLENLRMGNHTNKCKSGYEGKIDVVVNNQKCIQMVKDVCEVFWKFPVCLKTLEEGEALKIFLKILPLRPYILKERAKMR